MSRAWRADCSPLDSCTWWGITFVLWMRWAMRTSDLPCSLYVTGNVNTSLARNALWKYVVCMQWALALVTSKYFVVFWALTDLIWLRGSIQHPINTCPASSDYLPDLQEVFEQCDARGGRALWRDRVLAVWRYRRLDSVMWQDAV